MRSIFTDKSVLGATVIMADISDSTQSYSTDMFWTDIQNASGYMNVTTKSLDPSGTTPPSLWSLIFPVVFFALIVLANIISLGAFLLEKRLRTYNNYFIINLTILDLLVGIGLGAVIEHSYIRRYPFSQNACRIISGIFEGIVNASNINVVVICADRHQAVYDPINHYISRSKRKAIIINSLPWVIGLSFWIGYVTVWGVRRRSRQRTSMSSAVPSQSVGEYDPKCGHVLLAFGHHRRSLCQNLHQDSEDG